MGCASSPVVCSDAPDNTCLDGGTLRIYTAQGSCGSGISWFRKQPAQLRILSLNIRRFFVSQRRCSEQRFKLLQEGKHPRSKGELSPYPLQQGGGSPSGRLTI